MRAIVSTSIAVLLTLPTAAQDSPGGGVSREVVLKDGDTVTLRVAVAEPSRNLLTAVALPQAVQEVVSAWDAKDLSVEHAGSRLFLKLLSKATGHLDVITSGGHYRLLIVPAPPEGPFDSTVAIKRPEAPPAGRPETQSASGAVELVRAMRLGEVPPEATVRSGKSEVLFTSEDLQASLAWVYETDRYRGYVLAVTNRSAKEAYELDASRFAAEKLVLVGSKDVLVRPGRATRLYLVFWK